ncbi:MAG: asparagine synthase-related protein [Sedimenticolaceae bacterium]
MNIPGLAGRVAVNMQSPPDALPEKVRHLLGAGDLWGEVKAPGIMVGVMRGESLNQDGICCALSGNLDWLDYELADIQIKRSPAHALMQAYRRHGVNLLSVVGGRFVILLWDSAQRTGLLACDRFGQMPIYWANRGDDDVVFGPTASAVNLLLDRRPTLSQQGIFNYLYFHMVPGPATVFEGVNKLMAAHMLVCRDGAWEVQRYWEPDFREHSDASLTEASEEMLGLLSSSVARLTEGADTGAFLSGGLDSSTVCGLLARHQPQPKTYSIGFAADDYDEIAYARLASKRFDTDFRTYYVTPEDVLSELPRIAAAYDEPFGNSSALPAYFCARYAASDGRRRLLAGDGGDELFAGNERYAKQAVFERYAQIPWLARRLLDLLMQNLPSERPLIKKVRSYVRQAKIPLPERLQTYNFLNQFGAQGVVTEALLESVDEALPLELDRAIYQHPARASTLNRMLYLDWHHTLADNDLRKVNRMCQLAGIDVEYPMLDDRLVEFSTRVSSARKMYRNRLRDFYKRAVADLLPAEIINKPKHGFGLPFGVWMAEHPGLQEFAADNLSRMRRRQIVRADFVDDVLRLHREQHAGYYGEFIWVLIMLELWLTAHGYEP